jgi:hypothetical protein
MAPRTRFLTLPDPPPAHDAIDLTIRAALADPGELGPLFL